MKHKEVLTDREYEVLALSTFGLKIPKIAEKLVISEYTVKNHFNSIYEKFNVHNRVQAAVTFIQMGYEAVEDERFSKEYNEAVKELTKTPPTRKNELW